jgi:hypothetical protein
MKRDTAEKWMLLEQSGELGPVRGLLLRRHLARHPEDRTFRDDMVRIVDAARDAGDVPGIDAQVRAAIRAAADRRVEEDVAPSWRPALAFAALVLVLAAGWLVFRHPPAMSPSQVAKAPAKETVAEADLAWDNGIDAEISELQNMFAMGADGSDASDAASTDTTDVETIARELLQLEGSEI